MRLVQVAKALGMTGQQLRKELLTVEFGIKPTDREVPDNLAQGIIRFIARKNNIVVDMESLGFTSDAPTTLAAPTAEKSAAADPVKPSETADPHRDTLHVLRKLSLEDVPKEAIQQQRVELQRKPQTKAERELIAHENKIAGTLRRPEKTAAQGHQEQIKVKEGTVHLPEHVTVKEFAEKTGIQVPRVIQALMSNGVMVTINQTIDFETASVIAADLHVQVEKEQSSTDVEHLLSRNLAELLKDEPERLQTRPPIVVVMGHVDHGKTAILDAIRLTDVVSQEAGGITQHIGAYQVEFKPTGSDVTKKITFLDTPGHEAFTAMRARGAQVTDVAIIVVSAEEGVRPTTVEAINHAKDAKVPMIVAINKIDKENANPDKVKGELAANGVQPEEWGGDTPFVLCSAVTKQGIPELLETIAIVAELHDLKANPNRPAVCTVIESHLDIAHGPLGTVIVNAGTLQVGDVFICGLTTGRIRTMMDAHGKRLEAVTPSGAVRISGFSEVPQVGDIFQVVSGEKEARGLVDQFRDLEERRRKRSFADLVTRLSEGKLTQLKVVLKADAQGSLEALKESLAKLSTNQVSVKIIHAGVGPVTESDAMMAAASDGIVIAFGVPAGADVLRTAEREGVEVRQYDIVYALLDDVTALVSGLVEPVEEEKIYGHLEVKQIFLTKKSEQIVGGRVTDGIIKRLPFRLQRGGELIGSGRFLSLRHVDKDIKEAKEGTECGMRVEASVPIEVGDVFEVYLKELKKKV